MRILCLNLQQPQDSSCAEIFLKFSPRVQFRAPHYVFVDIDSTSHLFGGEAKLLRCAIDVARSFAPTATGSIADTPYTAQALVHFKPFEITDPREDHKVLFHLPLVALQELEGLEPWSKPRQVDHIIAFFQMIGLHTLEELYHFELSSFRERWGEMGTILWKRLQQREQQTISPLHSTDILHSYKYLDEPVSEITYLDPEIQKVMNYLFLRLEGLCRFAQRVEVQLTCEYSDHRHLFAVEPVSPSRDLVLFMDLIRKRLDALNLENPIREFEISIYDVPEKLEQLDFFEPRNLEESQWKRLISFAKQADCEMGFLQSESSHLPEQSFSFQSDWPADFKMTDFVERKDETIKVRTSYAKNLHQGPRPSLLLKEPEPLSENQVQHLQLLSRIPAERIESAWWKNLFSEHPQRDYFLAISEEGQMLWVYKNIKENSYYLHGYFD